MAAPAAAEIAGRMAFVASSIVTAFRGKYEPHINRKGVFGKKALRRGS